MGIDILNRLENHRVLSVSGTYTADFNSDVYVSGTLYAATIVSGGGTGSVSIDGLVPYVGAISGLDMGGYSIKSTGSITGSILGYVGSYVGSVYVPEPTADPHAATKKYVDDQITGENFWNRSGTTLLPLNAGDSVSGTKFQGNVTGSVVGDLTGSVNGIISGPSLSYLGSFQGTTGSLTGSMFAGRFIGDFGGVYDAILTSSGAVVVYSGNVVTA